MLKCLQNVSRGYSSGFISYKKMEKNSNYGYRERWFYGWDFTDTNPENNWYQFYTNYKWIGTKWKDNRLLVLSLEMDCVQ